VTAVSYVVAVSGMSGAGKTSVVRRAVELLGDAVALHFDDYKSVSTYPPDLRQWLEEGSDVDVWRTPRLAADIRALLAGEPIVLPESGASVEPAEVLVLEEPFGKMRREMTGLIDLAVHIDVPADVLLARRLLRRLDEERHLYGDGILDQLQRDLHGHLTSGRQLEARGAIVARDKADLVLNGAGTVEELAQTVVEAVHARRLGKTPD
jgi:uridine kinase